MARAQPNPPSSYTYTHTRTCDGIILRARARGAHQTPRRLDAIAVKVRAAARVDTESQKGDRTGWMDGWMDG
ncbi:hypothetical protein V9T40_014834 [Parthenolecanium corni]|uniref:Uncharacterized protein n=1 Tax=Parthenolecanium corni TaxID=536013 RepID=A0AAN9TFW6_9HEMI